MTNKELIRNQLVKKIENKMVSDLDEFSFLTFFNFDLAQRGGISQENTIYVQSKKRSSKITNLNSYSQELLMKIKDNLSAIQEFFQSQKVAREDIAHFIALLLTEMERCSINLLLIPIF